MTCNHFQSGYYTEIGQLDKTELPAKERFLQLKRLLERYCKETTANESLQFPSLFSRLVFIAQKYHLPKSLEWQLQNLRVRATYLLQDSEASISADEYLIARQAFIKLIRHLSGETIQEDASRNTHQTAPIPLDRIRVQVTEIDREKEILHCRTEHLSDNILRVRYNVAPINELFNSTIDRLWIGAQLNLIDVRTDEEGQYIPKAFVLEPDYLIDASAIAECFQNYGSSYLHYFRRKFEQPVNSHYILLGNLANFFLDELIYANNAKELTFEETFLKSFRQMPFEYASCKDIQSTGDFKDFMLRARIQFDNIKRVVTEDMPANGFDISACTLEPSFYSEKYGFQGRLDLLQYTGGADTTRILELKSGKPPYPREDVTKIAPNHEAQTVVYRLMIQSVFGLEARDIYAAILYSSAENKGENIRLAATYQQLEKEIVNTRNLIVATEHDLYTGDSETAAQLFDELFDIANYNRVPDFFVQKLTDLHDIINNTSELEREYFYRFIAFISRELYLQKMGDEGYDSSMSTSTLWNTAFSERKDALELISGLEIEEIDDSGRDMKIRFRRTELQDCINFREGEICILYPRQENADTILSNQILKGNVMEITEDSVLLRFRYKQKNRAFFSQYRYWVVEHDKLDHSYNAMYRSLSAFLASPKDKRQLLLGERQPKTTYTPDSSLNESVKEDKQQIVINKALAAKDYFLLVGPPGTGKTSIYIRRLIEELYKNPDAQILVIAYTNRAVDELCAAICSVFGENAEDCDKYIRVGTELSCAEPYRHRLLQILSQDVQSRAELTKRIGDNRIFVGTLASIVGRPELFEMKHFDIALIDEASQILEPQIIGLLPQFDKFVMIGDHKQLSTITLQNKEKSIVNNALLNDIELTNCRESLFERLYRICEKNGWEDAYDTLTFHGRMHEEIAAFVNINFYDNQLQIATNRQKEKLPFTVYDADNSWQQLAATKRIAFIPNNVTDTTSLSDKVNIAEANIVKQLVEAIRQVYEANGQTLDMRQSIGIITPYRNQIALIKQQLRASDIPSIDNIMIDTVERYQGSQRDIIIVSCCFNKPYQLQYFSNMDREGRVDRKLNVALTRAREQLFIIGNDSIMQWNSVYQRLIEATNI
ncbi:AAA domain-containing protein [Dysgonomonas sp. 25]|uniref:ATP-dependent helicase n=1 Tax=Dysgonomonas sp. 25 TaxID=2302933 RepID=UPI0013D3BA8D|nr:AAA domain-containing protein [Dysgonomonas sp. 25]NDV67810.1 hypothetical protein [Dysgonomonas sp. 25]